jgi:hypothetical protein
LGTFTHEDKTGVYNTDQLPLPSTLKSTYSTLPAGNFRDSRNEPRPRNDLSAVLTKATFVPHQGRIHVRIPVPRDYEQAVSIDEDNKNTKWQDSTTKEFREIDEYETFNDKGKDINLALNTRDVYISSTLSNMTVATRHVSWQEDISLKHPSTLCTHQSFSEIRIVTFLSELNGCETWSTDVSCAYLRLHTGESVHRRWPKFGLRADNIKALYGLKSSGLRWSQRFADVLRQMGFFLSKAEKDIWMRDKVITTNT